MTLSKLAILDQNQLIDYADYQKPVDTARLQAFLDSKNLNWGVEKRSLFDGYGNDSGLFGVYRTDDNHCFGSFTNKYSLVQNETFGEFALSVIDALGLDERSFSVRQFDRGAVRILSIDSRQYQVEVPNARRSGKVGDIISEKFCIIDSYDGSKALGFSFGHEVLSCTNGMTRFDKKGYFSMRHSGDLDGKIKEAVSALRKVSAESQRMIGAYEKMSKVKINDETLFGVWEMVTGYNPKEQKYDELGKQRRETVDRLAASLDEELSYKGKNLWGLFNAVTHYTTRVVEEKPERAKAKINGRLSKTDLSVFDYLATRANAK